MEKDAEEYWLSEIGNRAQSTKEKYTRFFDMFCKFVGMTPNQIYEARKQDMKKDDMIEARRFESLLKKWMVKLEGNHHYSVATRQLCWASVKSFFDTIYMGLRMRKGDYPAGESLGKRAFTQKELRKLVSKMPLRTKFIVHLLKDTGLRVGDAVRLKWGDISEQVEAGEKFVSIKLVTQKSRVVARCFLGAETVELLKKYMERRRKGTRRVPPEKITKDSWLIRHHCKMKNVSTTGISSLITSYIKKESLGSDLSCHSLRKFCQTQLESGGVHGNWVMRIIGHKLVGVEGRYSKPTDEMLKNAYIKAYDSLRITPRAVTLDDLAIVQRENQRLKSELVELRQRQNRMDRIREEFMTRLEAEVAKEIAKVKVEAS